MDESIDFEDIVGRDGSIENQNVNFVLFKALVDRIVDELDENLKLFFRVMVGFRNLLTNHEWKEIRFELITHDKCDIDVLINRLKHIHTKFGFSRYKVNHRIIHHFCAIYNAIFF